MKIVRFLSDDGRPRHGRLTEDGRAQPLIGDLFDHPTFAAEPMPVTTLLPPVEPPNIFAIGRNYRKHVEETGARLPEQPLVFLKPTTSLLAPAGTILLPNAAPNEVDFEAELAIVIGRVTRQVPANRALDAVLGYTCANDVSARDCQRNDKQWSRAKGFDTFCPIGPCLVTPDEFDPDRCAIRSRLNGEIMQEANTDEMLRPCGELISFLSHQFTLLPGTLILTGTPAGVGMARQPPRFLRDGDQIEIELDGIGILKNRVSREADG